MAGIQFEHKEKYCEPNVRDGKLGYLDGRERMNWELLVTR